MLESKKVLVDQSGEKEITCLPRTILILETTMNQDAQCTIKNLSTIIQDICYLKTKCKVKIDDVRTDGGCSQLTSFTITYECKSEY